jgi:CRISPR-associated protein Cas1
MALHALAYCERLFYLEEVEEIRLADEAVYAGRRLHEELAADEGEIVSLVLESETLGLKGKVDCLRRRDGRLIPYEHKRGRAAKGEQGPEPWPSDRVQVCAYALLVEEHAACSIEEARIRYHADNVTVRVPVDHAAREAVRQAVTRAKELRRSVDRPPVTENDRLCLRCSLAPVCLPEEERLANDPDWKPIRLFPADRERKTLHVTEPGARVTRAGNTLVVLTPEQERRVFPIHDVGEIVLHGHAQATTQVIHLCAHEEIGLHWMTGGGRFIASLAPGASPVQRRIRQYEALRDPGLAFRLAKRLALARVASQLRFLLRASQGIDRGAKGIQKAVDGIRTALAAMSRSEGLDDLRGHEGEAGRAYFSGLPGILREDLDSRLLCTGRSRRPPQDCFNAVLSFGYSLLHRDVMQAIIAVGLEPAFGFYHQPRSAAHPLALDVMEEFRVPVWDMPVVASLNRLQWDPEQDFTRAGPQVWLSDSGRKKAIELYEHRKEDEWKHPVVGYSLSYARLIELEVRLLEKEWTGQPGLFARLRLR